MKEYYTERKTDNNKGILLFVLGFSIIAVAVMSFCVGVWMTQDYNGRQQVESITPKLLVYNSTTYVTQNNTALLNEIKNITTILNKDEVWESLAIVIAEDDWNTERHLYNALLDLNITDISDKSDIDRVVIKETDVSNSDADEKSADVEQVVRVYYESNSGDDKRVNLLISTEIIDGEVEDCIYELD